jgi:hypothetical protein
MCLKIEDLQKIEQEFQEYYSEFFLAAITRYRQAIKIKR